MLIYFLFGLASFTILMLGVIAFDRNGIFPSQKDQTPSNPFVSILISARNESSNIEELCQSLDNLIYPKSSFEILIGDDSSEDDTFSLLSQFAPVNTRLFQSEENDNGKLAMLKRLAAHAKGDAFLFTDADVVLNPNWIQGMLLEDYKSPQLQLGITMIQGDSWLDQLQNIDWLVNQTLISWITQKLGPITAWGNNMSVDRKTFESINGYAGIDASIIEDVELMRKTQRSRGKVWVKATPETLIKSKPCPTISDLIQQRVRWLEAYKGLPAFLNLGLIVKLVFLPTVLLLGLVNLWYLILIPLKTLLLYLITKHVSEKIDQPVVLRPLLVFEFYEFAINFMTFVHYLLPFKLNWKGRTY